MSKTRVLMVGLLTVSLLVLAVCSIGVDAKIQQHTPVPLGMGDEEQPTMDKMELVKLIVINRHGHRSPNAAYWSYCPNDAKNREKYNVDSEDLSILGMKEEVDFGAYIRKKYGYFIGDRFNRTLHFFRSVGEPRILQSAVCVAQGMFPDGFGPKGFFPSRPQFVPIFSDMETHEYLLDDVPCFGRATYDVGVWVNTTFPKYMEDPTVKATLKYMHDLCGKPTSVNPVKPFAYIKTVADGIVFNTDYGLKVAGKRLRPEDIFAVRNLSTHLLLGRLYYTDEQQTYTSVDLPRRLIRLLSHQHLALDEAMRSDFHELRQTSDFFFVHREALYALAQFYGFQYRVIGLPEGEIPVASSLIMENFLEKKQKKGWKNGKYVDLEDSDVAEPEGKKSGRSEEELDADFGVDKLNATTVSKKKRRSYIKFTLWTPYNGKYTLPLRGCRNPYLCQVEELHAMYQERIARTGSWEELCNFTKVELNKNTDIR